MMLSRLERLAPPPEEDGPGPLRLMAERKGFRWKLQQINPKVTIQLRGLYSGDNMPRLHLMISGRVQGVYYRQSSKQKADSLSLQGWVRNRSNGDVELVAEGPKSDLEDLLAWCKKGPAMAQVASVQSSWAEPVGMDGGFFDTKDSVD